MNWWVIVLLILLIYGIHRVGHLKHKFYLILTILLILFVYASFSYSIEGQKINWKSVSGVEQGAKLYFSWLAVTFDNLKSITTQAIKLDWTTKNNTADTIRIAAK